MSKYFLIVILFFIIFSCNEEEQTYQPFNYSNDHIQDTLVKANKYLLERDKEQIENYIKRRSWKMDITESGLRYEIFEKTKNEQIKPGDIVKYKYQIELLDGTICYSSDSTGAVQIKIGQSGKELGLEEGLLMMKSGDKGRFIMPPYLAHGLIGDLERIPHRSIIVYTVEIVDIIDF